MLFGLRSMHVGLVQSRQVFGVGHGVNVFDEGSHMDASGSRWMQRKVLEKAGQLVMAVEAVGHCLVKLHRDQSDLSSDSTRLVAVLMMQKLEKSS